MSDVSNSIDRQAAAEAMSSFGFPTAKTEPWRYSQISRYQDRDWGENVSGAAGQLVLAKDEPNVFVQMNRAKSVAGYRQIGSGELCHSLTAQHEHSFIQLAAGEKAVVIEDLATGATSVGTSLTEIELAEGAELIRVQLRRHGEDSAHVGHTAVNVAGNATFTNIDFNVGGGLARNEIQVKLLDRQARVNLYGTYLLDDSQHADTITYVEHKAPETFSKEVYKGVVDGRGRGVFQGKIRVDQDAQQIEGHQLSRGLMLSPRARIDVKPELEIFADDVICSHGATIGDLDEQQLFYLRSRGIDEATAKGMLVQAFIAEIIDLMPDQIDREALTSEVVGWLTA